MKEQIMRPGRTKVKKRGIWLAAVLWAVLLTVILGSLAGIYLILSGRNAQEPEEEPTDFRIALDTAISRLSEEDGKSYVLDEYYYNEYRARTYVSVMAETGDITPDLIKEYIWQIFVPSETGGAVSLEQKDSLSMILDCPEGGKMDVFDYRFMGLINNEVIERSNGLYFSQNSREYENLIYGDSNARRSGCGPACLALAINHVRDEKYVTLEDVISWANENKMYVPGAGTSWELLRRYPSAVGMECKELYIDSPEKLEGAISDGEALITSMGRGHFTNNGHFIVITSVEGGKARVLDPACVSRSMVDWDLATIVSESKKYFWKISLPEQGA